MNQLSVPVLPQPKFVRVFHRLHVLEGEGELPTVNQREHFVAQSDGDRQKSQVRSVRGLNQRNMASATSVSLE